MIFITLQAWQNEKLSPDLLQPKVSVLETVVNQVKLMVSVKIHVINCATSCGLNHLW